jgi:uroporphyrinogen decarboxylase
MNEVTERAADASEIDLSAKAVIARFQARFDESQVRAQPSKEWVRASLERKGAPRCPVRLKRTSYDLLARHGDALGELFRAYPDDLVLTQPYESFIGFRGPGMDPVDTIRAFTEEAEWTDEWGTSWGHAAGGVGATPTANPLTDWSQLDDYLASHVPDGRDPGRLAGAKPSLELHGANRYYIGMTYFGLFERFHGLRGMENTFEDFYTSPREVHRLLDALLDYQVATIREWGQLANVDTIFTTDDWGSQLALMIRPDMWREFFAARYRRMIDEAHRWGMAFMFHSCGNVFAIIGDLIDAGVDIVDPLQPEAMDLKAVAREFGGKVAFAGGISDQRLERISPGQVRDEVRRAIDILGAPYGNAYMIAPSNMLMPGIPLENLVALFEACHDQ